MRCKLALSTIWFIRRKLLRWTECWPSLGEGQVEVTADDPGALSRPWTFKMICNVTPEQELPEFVCGEKRPEYAPGVTNVTESMQSSGDDRQSPLACHQGQTRPTGRIRLASRQCANRRHLFHRLGSWSPGPPSSWPSPFSPAPSSAPHRRTPASSVGTTLRASRHSMPLRRS
jgi:hypothetical protein